MTYKEIKAMIESIGLPYNYYQWPGNTAPELPFLIFYYPGRNDFMADGINYQHITKLNIELYTDDKDFDSEAKIEEVLEENSIAYEKEEQYIYSERMYEVLYTMEVVLNG